MMFHLSPPTERSPERIRGVLYLIFLFRHLPIAALGIGKCDKTFHKVHVERSFEFSEFVFASLYYIFQIHPFKSVKYALKFTIRRRQGYNIFP